MKYVFLFLLILLNIVLASFAFQSTSIETTDLEKKIGAMLVAAANPANVEAHHALGIQAVHVFLRDTPQEYQDLIGVYRAVNPSMMVSADLEGCRNPFPWHDSLVLSELEDTDYLLKFESDLAALNQVGVNLNFAPVLDLGDTVWGCRSLSIDPARVTEFGVKYVNYFESNGVRTSVKHYPGATLYDDTHLITADNVLAEDDVEVFHNVIRSANPSMVMVNHLVSTGYMDSGGMPNSVSPATISTLRSVYDGVIVSDELSMLGLVEQFGTLEEVYLALILAGVDMVPYFSEDPNDLHNFVQTISSAVESGLITEERIDESYNRIMRLQNK